MENLRLVDSSALINTHSQQNNNPVNTGTNNTNVPGNNNTGGNNNDIKYLLGGLKNDGIITSNDYTVEIRGGRLIVDGKEQPDEVNAKYQKYLNGKADMMIKETKVK
jgi:hypothetical protein